MFSAMTNQLHLFLKSKMVVMCPKIQIGTQNDIFKSNENMTLCTTSSGDFSVYLDVLGTKNTLSSFSKFKMAVKYKKIQNGCQSEA